jgi:hypothetical protein
LFTRNSSLVAYCPSRYSGELILIMDVFVPAEFELQRRPPRSARNREGKWGDLKPYLIFLVPHIWIAIAAPFVLFSLYYQAFAAEPLAGKVVSHATHHSKNGGGYYHLQGTFDIGEKQYNFDDTVSRAQYETAHDGDPITVYATRLNPSSPRLKKEADLGALLFATVWTFGWCGGCFAIIWVVLSQPLRSKSLVKIGIVTPGTLTGIREQRGKGSMTYYAKYSYSAKQNDKQTGRVSIGQFTGEMKLKNDSVASARSLIGKDVTVLMDEKNPKRSIIYQFCDHVVVT